MFPIILVQIELFDLHFWKPAREISRIYNVMFIIRGGEDERMKKYPWVSNERMIKYPWISED